ncbi:MAG: serine protease [Lachnospiraceae bacterium]|nr:serine protease [Lachnospiraceae bacterium]
MVESEQNRQSKQTEQSGHNTQQSDFMIEKIKERPVNKRKLIRRTMLTAAMAVVFGTIACLTFLLLEPVISDKLHPDEEPTPIVFPEDQEEMAPEDMLSENITGESNSSGDGSIDQDQAQEILSKLVLDKNNYKQIYTDMSRYVNELNHSMVVVTGVSSNIDWFNNVEESKNQSFGIVIANNGKELLILTDYAPLKKAESLTLRFVYLEGAISGNISVPAVLKGQDKATGFAVLSVDLSEIPDEILNSENGIKIASLGASSVRSIVGTPVVALGNPMGSSGSVGYGMICAVSVQNQQADAYFKYLQTDIYGSQNAGGVLFNLQGQVLGVITGQKTNMDMKNMITAVGISELKRNIEKLSNDEEIAYLGINGTDVTEEANLELGVPYGTFVRETDMSSPAMRAGIQRGDVLVAFGDSPVKNYNDYITALLDTKPGAIVELAVMRSVMGEYREMAVSVTLDER